MSRFVASVASLVLFPCVLHAASPEEWHATTMASDVAVQSETYAAEELLGHFCDEPTMADVREAAIRYAEAQPKKILQWRRQASLRALLPKVAIGIDRSRSLDAHFDEGTFPRFQIIETQAHDTGIDVSMTWELGDLIWNNDQTSIDVRSKFMVELRNNIVKDVTRAYFERRRLQIRLLTNSPSDPIARTEQELRIQELTASLDGFTGGYFSQDISTHGSSVSNRGGRP